MSVGLMALLDDVAGIAKIAAASVDDVAAHSAKAASKAAGVVIDDTAVTPRFLVGFAAERELPIVGRIALGSLRNKLLILVPVAMLLSALAPWAITPLLMLGGLYLCYEGAEKVYEAVFPHDAHEHEARIGLAPTDPKALEDQKVAGAIRTDFVLSAEIVAIALATIPEAGLPSQLVTLIVVSVAITAGVYGVVALIVKADDVGVHLARSSTSALQIAGRGLVRVMPPLLATLAVVGTAAMIWVGGGIVVHGLDGYGLAWVAHAIHDAAAAAAAAVPVAAGAVEWTVGAAGAGILGLVLGGVMIPVVSRLVVPAWKGVTGLRGRG